MGEEETEKRRRTETWWKNLSKARWERGKEERIWKGKTRRNMRGGKQRRRRWKGKEAKIRRRGRWKRKTRSKERRRTQFLLCGTPSLYNMEMCEELKSKHL